jgi:hypothetical protein
MSDNSQLVVERIERAFAGVRLGAGVSLREADVIDDYGTEADRKKARAQDELEDWKRIPDDLISRYYSCLSFFDAEGMRFHLPAYMRFALRHYKDSDSASIDSTIFALGYDDDRFSLLTAPQRAAVRQFLKFMAFNGGHHVSSDRARLALEEVWKKAKGSQENAASNAGWRAHG